VNGVQNINLDSQTLEQCLKTINRIGSTTFQNICNGQVSSVPWGGVDWILVLTLWMLGLAFLVVMIRAILS